MEKHRFNMELEHADPNAPLWVDETLKVMCTWRGEHRHVGDAEFSNEGKTWQWSPDLRGLYEYGDLVKYLDELGEEIDEWINEHMSEHWPTLDKQGPTCPYCFASILRPFTFTPREKHFCPNCGATAYPYGE